MTLKTKDKLYLLIIVVLGVLAGVFIFYKLNDFSSQLDAENLASSLNNTKPVVNQSSVWEVYHSKHLGFSLSYPIKLQLQEIAEGLELSHQVPFKNYGECDMKGDANIYNILTDFRVRFQIFNGNVAQAAKQFSSYLTAENFQGETLKVTPGYIDTYEAGNLRGFSIYEGAEGCGRTIYYFPIDSNQKTFVVTKDMVQILSGVISSDLVQQLSAVPGVIDNQQSRSIFERVLNSVQFTDSTKDPASTSDQKLIGGGKDAHGCLIGVG